MLRGSSRTMRVCEPAYRKLCVPLPELPSLLPFMLPRLPSEAIDASLRPGPCANAPPSRFCSALPAAHRPMDWLPQILWTDALVL